MERKVIDLIKQGLVYKYPTGYLRYYVSYRDENGHTTTNAFSDDENKVVRKLFSSIMLQDNIKITTCETCGKVIIFDESIMEKGVDTEICDECIKKYYFLCDNCGMYHRNNEKGQLNDGRELCYSCLHELNYEQCIECKKWFSASELVNGMCNECINSRETILSYHNYFERYEYVPQFAKDEPINYATFGVEIEVQGERKVSGIVSKTCGDIFHMENDSSIGHNGFEMISQPLSMARWYEIKNRLNTLFNELNQRGIKGDTSNGCGFHIHVNRLMFKNRKAIYRALAIVNGLSHGMQKLGRRSNGGYYRFSTFNINNMESLYYNSKTHGCSVNVANHTSIEFRFPKSTIDLNTFYATLELINNIVMMSNSKQETVCIANLINGEYISEYANNMALHNGLNLNETVSLIGIDTSDFDMTYDENSDYRYHEKVVY